MNFRILKAEETGKVVDLSVPKYRQDPLLRQLARHPERFQVEGFQVGVE